LCRISVTNPRQILQLKAFDESQARRQSVHTPSKQQQQQQRTPLKSLQQQKTPLKGILKTPLKGVVQTPNKTHSTPNTNATPGRVCVGCTPKHTTPSKTLGTPNRTTTQPARPSSVKKALLTPSRASAYKAEEGVGYLAAQLAEAGVCAKGGEYTKADAIYDTLHRGPWAREAAMHADFWIGWASANQKMGDTARAMQLYTEGTSNKAQPVERLRLAYLHCKGVLNSQKRTLAARTQTPSQTPSRWSNARPTRDATPVASVRYEQNTRTYIPKHTQTHYTCTCTHTNTHTHTHTHTQALRHFITSVDARGSSVARSSSHTFNTPSKRLDLLEAVESATPLTDRLRGAFADLDQVETERRGQGEASRHRHYQVGDEETRRKLAEEGKVTAERVQRQQQVVSLQQEAARELAMHLQKQKEMEKKRLEERITATAAETRAVVEAKTIEMRDSLRREMEAEQAVARQAQVCVRVCMCVCVCTRNFVHVIFFVYVDAHKRCAHVGALINSARVYMYVGYGYGQ
jgi:hypothetical protein